MATYRQVKQSFWTDHLVSDNFSAEDKYFFLYLLTNIHTNLCGCYEVSKTQAAKEMGYSEETINSVIDRFENKYNIIRYNKKTCELLILNWSKHNWTDSPKFRKLVEKEIESIKDKGFKEYLMGIFNGESTGKYPIQTPDTVSGVPDTSLLVTISNTVTDTVNSNSSFNSLTGNDIEEVNGKREVTKKQRKKYEDTPEFTEFWNAYPKVKQKSKQDARVAFEKADVPLQTLLDALEIQKKSRDWTKDGGQYIPYPATWLNKRRWEDSDDSQQQTDRYSNLRRLMEELDDE